MDLGRRASMPLGGATRGVLAGAADLPGGANASVRADSYQTRDG